MQFALSEEQAQLQEIARSFLADLPDARSPSNADTWPRIVEEQGWPAVAVPEEQGGFGFGWIELSVVFEELGRALTSAPMLGTGMATAVLLESSPSAARDQALEQIAAGTPATVCWDGLAIDIAAGGIVIRHSPSGFELFADGGTEATTLLSLDETRPLHEVSPTGTGVALDADEARVRARCETLLAWECVGAAEACMDLAVEYAKVRKQFAKPIGSFQAIQHMCADLLVVVESARSAAWFAAWAVENDAPDARVAARTAKALASEALFTCAGQSIQIHGGIGFTWEHDAHLYFKRARANLSLLGEPREHRMAIANTLLGDA
ncbi:MAG: acyl-CoA/acyl-ACP dehydrogenase [Proteobacteria bacterium]|nr:acyl-CoA/acyl-ACP dehydrogenase [Pseudomonadota bacterium]